jgi:predicted site-specific integrase-resolvase
MDQTQKTGQALNEKQAAAMLGVSMKTLQAWRFQGKGPAYCKLGRAVRYLPQDLTDYAQGARIQPRN